MIPTEMVAVIRVLSAACKTLELHEDTLEVWTDGCADIDVIDGIAAARRLASTDEWFPSLHRFRECARGFARSRQPALPEPTPSPADAARIARAIRAGMAAAAQQIPAHRNHTATISARCPACTTRTERTRVAHEIIEAITDQLHKEQT